MFNHKTSKYAGEIEYKPVDGGKSVIFGIKQCCHCGKHWESRPGSGNRRGYCRNCDGDICSDHCAQRCEPYEKYINNIREQVLKGTYNDV